MKISNWYFKHCWGDTTVIGWEKVQESDVEPMFELRNFKIRGGDLCKIIEEGLKHIKLVRTGEISGDGFGIVKVSGKKRRRMTKANKPKKEEM